MKRARPEALLQESICELLRLTKGPHTLVFSIPNERECTAATMASLKKRGLVPGAADLVVVVAGQCHFLEFKAPDGRQSPEQRAFEMLAVAARCPYVSVRSFEEAQAALRSWNAFRIRRQA